jgi:hypothetical protein
MTPTIGCCVRDGRRVVNVSEADFTNTSQGVWYLFCVQVGSKLSKRRRRDVFYKFVLSPTNRMDGTKKHGSIRLRKGMVMNDLNEHLVRMRVGLHQRELEQQNHDNNMITTHFHFHIGLVMDVLRTELDTPRAIYEYRMACYKAIDECNDEDTLDEWIDRGNNGDCNTTRRTRFQPRQMSEAIPKMIHVDRSCSQSEAFTRNLNELGLNRCDSAAIDGYW